MEQLIEVALGKAPADILLKGACVVNVFNGEVEPANVALVGDKIAGVGDYHEGREVIDLSGCFLIPGLIDARIHLESSFLTPRGFARAAVPHGTTTVIGDPDELVNAIGLSGLEDMIRDNQKLPLDIYYQVPAGAPANTLLTAGVKVDTEAAAEVLKAYSNFRALDEMVSFPKEYLKNEDFLDEIREINDARTSSKEIDGLRSLVGDQLLQAYVKAKVPTDHESTSANEAGENLSLGVHILIQEGSAAKNLDQLLNIVNENTYSNCSFCSNQRYPADLITEGEIDYILRYAVAWGLDPVMAVRMATINPARLYGLTDRGAIAPGYLADITVVDSIYAFRVKQVYKRGVLVAENGKLTVPIAAVSDPALLKSGTPKVSLPLDLRQKLDYQPPVGSTRARVIDVLNDYVVTRQSWLTTGVIEPEYDVMKVAVIERYNQGGSVGLGFVRGFGLKTGALASTVAHDRHNLIVIGAEEEAMFLAAKTVAEMGGGLAVVSGNNKVLAALPLPIGGLMSDESAERIALKNAEVNAAAQGLGCTIYAPFMAMAYLTMPTIPALKITDQGLIDVNQVQLVDLWD